MRIPLYASPAEASTDIEGVTRLRTVSVVTPTRSRPDMLKEAYGSLRAQTLQDFEYIISVNGMNAKSLAEARRIESSDKRVRVLYNPNSNLSEAWNAGFEASDGETVHFLADDDLLEPMFLEVGYRALADRPDLDLVGTDYSAFADPTEAIRMPCLLTNPGVDAADSGRPALGAFGLNTSIFRRSLLLKMVSGRGPFDESFRIHGDEDFFVRLSKSEARAHHICSALVRYRVHPGQATQRDQARHFFEHIRVANSVRRASVGEVAAQTLWAVNRRIGFLGTRLKRKLGMGTMYRLSAIELLMYPELRV